ncbi:hypothetical protein Q8F55_004270 [Vanrija albida]|uniref:Ricin B lectin domain-containing protein n=1 Tax=Vanrija albida TaxID=181172 RepID=A0ABR3Q6A0_9TREE
MTLLSILILLALGLASVAAQGPRPIVIHPANVWPIPPKAMFVHPKFCFDCNYRNLNQLWVEDGGQVRLWADRSLCLDAGSNPASGSRVKLWTCYPGLAQQSWEKLYSSTRVELRIKGTNLCLDVTDGNLANGTPLQVWQCAGGNWNQMVNMLGVPEPN